MDNIRKDERFSRIVNDLRFKKVPVKDSKTKIDKRFHAMFKDKDFKLNYVMDKRGRPMGHASSEDLKKFYDVSSSDGEEDDDDDDNDDDSEYASECKKSQTSQDDAEETESTSLKKKDVEVTLKTKSRRKQEVESDEDVSEKSDDESDSDSSSTGEESDSTSEDDLENDGELDHKWEELDADAPVAGSTTKRLALCNMDWDRIRAEDILAVFNSFKPAESIIHTVKIYPSEYGLQRMEEEKLHGPQELVEKSVDNEEESNDPSKEGSKYHREKLRQYQINRLKYFYAIIECDTPETANTLYEQLNGMEYESSAVSMDIRFVPDDVEFDQEPKWVAASATDPAEYKPKLFANSALQQVKVNLTWDETDPKRRETLQKAFREPESIDKDIQDYLASSSSDSDNEDADDVANASEGGQMLKMKERIANYRALLQSIEEKEKDEEEKYDVEVSWDPGVAEKAEEVIREKMEAGLTPFEEKLKKDREQLKLKKKDKKEQMLVDENELASSESDSADEAHHEGSIRQKFKSKAKHIDSEKDTQMADELSLLMGDVEKQDFNKNKLMKKKKNKKEKKVKTEEKGDDFEVDINDDRFSAIYTSHLYNIDPSDPHYKPTKGMQTIVAGKKKKREAEHLQREQPAAKQSKLSRESRQLVDSVKRKANFRRKNK